MEKRLDNVFMVCLRTSGETYQSFIAASMVAVRAILLAKRITKAEESMLTGCWFFSDPVDPTQSAMVIEKPVVY